MSQKYDLHRASHRVGEPRRPGPTDPIRPPTRPPSMAARDCAAGVGQIFPNSLVHPGFVRQSPLSGPHRRHPSDSHPVGRFCSLPRHATSPSAYPHPPESYRLPLQRRAPPLTPRHPTSHHDIRPHTTTSDLTPRHPTSHHDIRPHTTTSDANATPAASPDPQRGRQSPFWAGGKTCLNQWRCGTDGRCR